MLPTEAWVFLTATALIWAAYLAYRHYHPGEPIALCPTCRHHTGLDDTGQCADVDNYSGFGPAHQCGCTDPHHQTLNTTKQNYGVA